MIQPASEPARPSPLRWVILTLVFIATALNYVDRQIVALLKPTLQAEFGWNELQYSRLGSAFSFAAALAFLGTGWFVDRVGLRWGYALGVAVWSAAGMAHAAATTVTQFIVARLTLGAAESVNTPAAVKAVAETFPLTERSLGLGVINTAPNIGAVLTPLLIPLLAVSWGWHAAFLIPGGLGFVWLAVWLAMTRKRPAGDLAAAPIDDGHRIAWAAMFAQRRTWAIAAAKVFSDGVWWFLLFWTPDLFHRQFGLNQGELGLPVALVYAMAAAGALTSGAVFPRLLAHFGTINRARKTSMLCFALLVLPIPLALYTGNAWIAALILGVALFAHQGFSTNVFGLAADIFPSSSVASAIGMGAFFGNIAGMAMQEATGRVLDAGLGYLPMFLFCALSYLFALLLVHLIVPDIDATAAAK